MRNTLALILTLGAASPALAASGPFFSLGNTDFVVLLGFIVFIAVLFYFKVPGMIGGHWTTVPLASSPNWTKPAPCMKKPAAFWRRTSASSAKYRVRRMPSLQPPRKTRHWLQNRPRSIWRNPSHVVWRRHRIRSPLPKHRQSKKSATRQCQLPYRQPARCWPSR